MTITKAQNKKTDTDVGMNVDGQQYRVLTTTLAKMLSEHYEWVPGESGNKPSVTAEDLLTTSTRHVVFIDETEEFATNEFAFHILYQLFIAAREKNHLLILSGNMNGRFLHEHLQEMATSVWSSFGDQPPVHEFGCWLANSSYAKYER